MKILIIRTFPDKLNLNTYNVQEVGLAKALIKKGHICDIVLYNGKNHDFTEEYKFSDGDQDYTFKIYWLQGFGILKNGFMPSIKKILPEYDVIQVHEYDQITSWNLYTKQVKPTVIYHGPYYDKFAKGYNLRCKVFDTFFLRLRKYQNVIAISKSTLATEFLHKKGFKNVITAGVGINLDNFKDSIVVQPREGKRNSSKKLLYVGKIEERRNLYFLMEVFRELQKQIPEVEFVIIGDGEKEYKERFLQSIKREIDAGSVLYYRRASQAELAKYYQEASIFMLASYYEIFGMVLLEAMYFGIPVISTVNGGSCTLIRDGYNGFVMEGFDVEQWTNCIQSVLKEDGMIDTLKYNAKNCIENYYTWDRLADKFVDAYEKAIDSFKA